MSTSLTPVSQIGKTIIGIEREIYAYSGLTPVYDTSSTLNTKYNTFPSLTPTSPPTVIYFGIGVGGAYNVSNTNLSQPYPILQTNMDLYQPIPFRCVPVEQDLSTLERAQYRMRVRKAFSGSDYFCYYLKQVTFNQTTISVTETDPTTGLLSPYVLNYSNLTPTPPTINSSGQVVSSGTEINVSVASTLPVTGAEVTEAINVIYNGDLRYAKISELGLYSGQDQTVSGLTGSSTALSYTEAVLAQLNIQYTWLGDDFSNPVKTGNYQITNGSGELVLL